MSIWFAYTTHLCSGLVGTVLYTSVTSALEREGQQDCDFKTSLGYMVRREEKGVGEGGGWERGTDLKRKKKKDDGKGNKGKDRLKANISKR